MYFHDAACCLIARAPCRASPGALGGVPALRARRSLGGTLGHILRCCVPCVRLPYGLAAYVVARAPPATACRSPSCHGVRARLATTLSETSLPFAEAGVGAILRFLRGGEAPRLVPALREQDVHDIGAAWEGPFPPHQPCTQCPRWPATAVTTSLSRGSRLAAWANPERPGARLVVTRRVVPGTPILMLRAETLDYQRAGGFGAAGCWHSTTE